MEIVAVANFGLIYGPRPGAVAKFRDRAGLVPSLVRKRCTCGAVVTAKQVKQQGACNACFKRAALFDPQIVGASSGSLDHARTDGGAFAVAQKLRA